MDEKEKFEKKKDAAQPTRLCGKRCPARVGDRLCDKPCRGYAGHEGPHQCNKGHTW